MALTKSKLIQLIHIAKSQLGLDDDAYREILQDKGKHPSCKGMSIAGLMTVYDYMKSLGFKPKRANINSGTLKSKIFATWRAMAKSGIVNDSSMAGLNSFIKRTVSVDRLEWLDNDQAVRVVESLKQWRKRVEG